MSGVDDQLVVEVAGCFKCSHHHAQLFPFIPFDQRELSQDLGIIPLLERECHHGMITLVERNVYQVEMPLLVERECHHWIIPLVEINVHQGLPIVESGDQGLPMVESGDQGPMETSNHVLPPLVERDWWKGLHVFCPISANEGVYRSTKKSRSHLPQ